MGNVESNLETARLLERYERPLIRNAWYCAAWADEVGDGLLARRILDTPVLLYRTRAGKAVALLDVCPHKLAPLSLGMRIGDRVQCGYHGLEFDCEGTCVRNPQGDGKLPNAKVRTYPLIERYSVLWIWLGQPERADPSGIMDYSQLDSEKWRTVKGAHRVNCNYILMVENLLDLGHVMFLHAKTSGVTEATLSEHSVEQDDTSVSDMRLYRDVQASPAQFRKYLPQGTPIDLNSDLQWRAPSRIKTHNGCSQPGRARDGSGLSFHGAHLLTPETQHTTHYFYAQSRNYALDDPEIDESYRRFQRDGLKAEDSRVAETIDRVLHEAMGHGVRMVTLSTDASATRVNRILDRMAAAEA